MPATAASSPETHQGGDERVECFAAGREAEWQCQVAEYEGSFFLAVSLYVGSSYAATLMRLLVLRMCGGRRPSTYGRLRA